MSRRLRPQARPGRHGCPPDDCRCQLCPNCCEWAYSEDVEPIPAVGWLCRSCARGFVFGPLDAAATSAAEVEHIRDLMGFDPFAGYPALLQRYRAAVMAGGRWIALEVLRALAEERRAAAGPAPRVLRRGAA